MKRGIRVSPNARGSAAIVGRGRPAQTWGPAPLSYVCRCRTSSWWRERSVCAGLLLIAFVSGGCSIKRMAVNKLGDSLASGGNTFDSDDDPDLVGESLPFALKLMESLLAQSPRHEGLLLATASGFTEYSYAFVGQRAERVFGENLEESNALRGRSRRLYLRARGYGMRALEVRYPGFGVALDNDPSAALARVQKRDVPVLYWTAAAHGLAISASKDDPEMIAQFPVVEAFVRRAMELDESWNEGALPEFLINIEAARSNASPAELQARMRRYYEQALRMSGGRRASLFVSYAENSCIQAQNRAQFRELLERALRIDPDQHPETRLTNLIAQGRARWLLSRIDDLFLEAPATVEKEK
jgi:predicted anti-sigma-YlaC factor YlaD